MPNVLIDQRTKHRLPEIIELAKSKAFAGFDIETEDSGRHEGLNKLMKVSDEGVKSKATKLIFDIKRTNIVGFSLYFGGTETFYFNLVHADIENRLLWSDVEPIFDSKGANHWIAHNAPFELTMLRTSWNIHWKSGMLCSMQLCVSAYNDDTYSKQRFHNQDLGTLKPLVREISKVFFGLFSSKDKLNPAQEKLLATVCAKESHSEACYNGYVREIAYGYGLKKAVKQHFNHQMMEFETLTKGYAHIGQLTGDQVVDYGCEDAYWCYRLFMYLAGQMRANTPQLWDTYLNQENPMIYIFSDAWVNGMKLNAPAIYARRELERENAAQCLREMKTVLADCLPFKEEPQPELVKYEAWYLKGREKYIRQITDWINQPEGDAFAITTQVKCATGNAWITDKFGVSAKPKATLSITHYMAMRVVLFDLCGLKPVLEMGKIQSDADARGNMGDHPILQVYNKLAGIEQRMKLYLTPYLLLVDPETDLVHPIMSSMLNTRRTACRQPNGQQLSKYGESAYVRGFFQADSKDELIVSADWSAIELVLIGEFSGDVEFAEAYGQRPHADLHSSAAAGVMGLPLSEFKDLPNKKELRAKLGKGANFEYWYSGWLAQVAKEMGWTMEETQKAVEGYRAQFSGGEEWRLRRQRDLAEKGFIELKDGHRRYRFEATQEWSESMRAKFDAYGEPAVSIFGQHMIRRVQKRCGNQGVNADIQGSCATMAKRTLIALYALLAANPHIKARFMLLIHDEVLFSVHKDSVVEFMGLLYNEMIQGRGIINTLAVDSSLAIGRTFQPWTPEASSGQIELMEMQKGLPCVDESRWGQRATVEEQQQIVDWLLTQPM
jgi:DNA polymerase I-like protein with 3'-5' exonuclease and polymerase domains